MPRIMARALRRMQRWLQGWQFPAFVLCVVGSFSAVLSMLLLVPEDGGALGRFAGDFRVWCFGYDPASGKMQWGYVVMLLLQPLILGAVVAAVWWRSLSRVIRLAPLRLVPVATLALLLVSAIAGGMATLSPDRADGALPFPAEALRTALPPPAFTLTDHEGATVSLDALRGRVVLVTAVYATCGYTCPMILGQLKQAVAGLTPEERDGLTIVAITLDPVRDTPAQLATMAKGQGVSAPLYHLVTGEPGMVNQALDDFSVARRRDPQTGVIDHTNLFILIDRQGRIAYRFSLGARQAEWLRMATRILLREPAGMAADARL